MHISVLHNIQNKLWCIGASVYLSDVQVAQRGGPSRRAATLLPWNSSVRPRRRSPEAICASNWLALVHRPSSNLHHVSATAAAVAAAASSLHGAIGCHDTSELRKQFNFCIFHSPPFVAVGATALPKWSRMRSVATVLPTAAGEAVRRPPPALLPACHQSPPSLQP